jgi:hypothetical protein
VFAIHVIDEFLLGVFYLMSVKESPKSIRMIRIGVGNDSIHIKNNGILSHAAKIRLFKGFWK